MKKIIVILLVIAVPFIATAATYMLIRGNTPEPVPTSTYVKDDYVTPAPEDVQYVGGGDCSAFMATGDLYLKEGYRPNSTDCVNYEGDAPESFADKVKRVIIATLTPFFTPTTQTPEATPEVTKTPAPTQEAPDNGNHYGNDKPDNNDKDNSKFDGADTRDDFETIKATETPKPEKTQKP